MFNNKMVIKSRNLIVFGGLLSASNLVVGGFGFVFQLMVGYFLSSNQFSLFAGVNSTLMFFGVPIFALYLMTTKASVDMKEKRIYYEIGEILSAQIQLVSIIFLLSTLVFFSYVFMFGSSEIVVFCVSLFLLNVSLLAIQSMAFGLFQATEQFAKLGAFNISAVLLKTCFVALLLASGVDIVGVFIGSVLASILNIYFCFRTLFLVVPNLRDKILLFRRGIVNKYLKINNLSLDFFTIFTSQASFVVLSQFDLIYVYLFGNAEQAPDYAMASIIAKAVFYLPGGLVSVMFPLVAKKTSAPQDSQTYFLSSIMLTLFAVIITCVLIFALVPALLSFIYGDKFQNSITFLLPCLAMFSPLAFLLVLKNYLLAKGISKFAFVNLSIAICFLTLSAVIDLTISDFILFNGVAGTLCLLNSVIFYCLYCRDEK